MNNSYCKDKRALILGGAGSIGSEIAKQLVKNQAKEIRIFSRDEGKHQHLFNSLGKPKSLISIVGDIRDKTRLSEAMKDIDVVFNAAALKSVPCCEKNPFETIKTNVIGIKNIIESALENEVEKVLFISTDKAVDPINTYGLTKSLSEKLLVAANQNRRSRKTIFTAVRLGNVLGSKNSVLFIIKNQILSGQPITVIKDNMTRFVMTATDASDLIFKALEKTKGGDIFIKKMKSLYIWDLIDVYIEELNNKYNFDISKIKRVLMNSRPGEKKYEKLISNYETNFTFDMRTMLAIYPGKEKDDTPLKTFKKINMVECNSDTAVKLSKKEIKELLKKI
jgi:FlaA1/EpsC-like NDP-sugar epimerase